MPDVIRTARPDRPPSQWARVAAAVVAIEALLLVALAAAYGIGIRQDAESSLGRALASIALFIVGATILGWMARAWLQGQIWPRMATLVLNALLVPVSFTMIRGDGVLIGAPVLLLGLSGVAAALASSPGPELPE